MKKHLLDKNQLFSLKRKTLEKRISEYYFETGDVKDTLEFLLVLQVREELTSDDFSFMTVDIVKHIFMKTKNTRLLRRLAVFFEAYFDKKEWKVLSRRLFTIKHFIGEKLPKLYEHFVKIPLEGLVGS
ncbi:hypothetical protein [Enterococcus sp. DIV0756]|uniref:hypothetical protein n=1 Tax=Enterococcus sp. DIV0756 TaxID=2774636 RepID=UPI003F2674DF